MDPSQWGPSAWMFIHYVALGYPDKNPSPEDRKNYRDFFINLWKVLPCYSCSEHYQQHLTELPPIDNYLSSNERLFEWTWMLHNKVNKALDKPIVPLAIARNILKTTHQPTSQKTNQWSTIGLIVVFVMLLVLIVLVVKKKNHR